MEDAGLPPQPAFPAGCCAHYSGWSAPVTHLYSILFWSYLLGVLPWAVQPYPAFKYRVTWLISQVVQPKLFRICSTDDAITKHMLWDPTPWPVLYLVIVSVVWHVSSTFSIWLITLSFFLHLLFSIFFCSISRRIRGGYFLCFLRYAVVATIWHYITLHYLQYINAMSLTSMCQ